MQRDLNHWNKYDSFAARPNALGSGGVAGPKSLGSSGPNVRPKALGSGFAAGPKTHGYGFAARLNALGSGVEARPKALGFVFLPGLSNLGLAGAPDPSSLGLRVWQGSPTQVTWVWHGFQTLLNLGQACLILLI